MTAAALTSNRGCRPPPARAWGWLEFRSGKAKEVLISVRWEPSQLRVVVDDDGGGFDVESRLSSTARTSLGLVGIQIGKGEGSADLGSLGAVAAARRR